MTLVDTNVVVDVLSANRDWLQWSVDALERRRQTGLLLINEVTYAELAVRSVSETDLQADIERIGLRLERTPVPALFAAGQTFRLYRTAGGPRLSLLPDFFIGAHAEASGLPILTRDPRRFRTYFPKVELITPET